MTGDQGQEQQERCGARGRGSGKPCRLPAGWGTNHVGSGTCRKHFGNAPTNAAHAAEKQARAAAERFGLAIKTTAAAALQDELARSNGLVVYYLARLQELDPAELVWGREKQTVAVGGVPGQPWRRGQQQGQPNIETTQAARPSVWLTLYQQERKHLAAVAVEMQRLGIYERITAVTETQAAQLKRVIDAVLGDVRLGLTPEQRSEIPEVVTGHLRALAAVPDG